jgi:hypothetical protein
MYPAIINNPRPTIISIRLRICRITPSRGSIK